MKFGLVIAAILVLVIGLWLANLWLIPDWYHPVDDKGQPTTRPIENPGIFGDMFGGLNSLFSGLSFAFIVVALLLQRQDLKAQQEDLKAQREEQGRVTDALELFGQLQTQQTQVLQTIALAQTRETQLNSLKAMIDFKEDTLKKLNASLPSHYVKNSPMEKRYDMVKRQIKQAEADLLAMRQKFQELNPDIAD